MSESEVPIKITLKGQEVEKFNALKKDIGVEHNTEVLRVLINREYKRLTSGESEEISE